MANTVWSLLMKLQGDASGLRSAVAQSEGALKGLQKNTAAVGRGMQSAGRGLTKAVTLPLVAGGAASIKMASDWESAFTGIKKTLGSDWNQDEIAKLGEDIRELSTDTLPVAANELAALGEAGGALGIAKGNMLEFIETSATLGETTDLTSEMAATALGHLNTTMNLSKGEFADLADAVVYLGNNGASTESQILGMTESLAGTTKLLGFAKDETLGWSSALANTGEEIEAGSSSLSRFFMETFKASQAGGKELKLMAKIAGTSAADFKRSMNTDISGTLQKLIEGMQGLTKAEQLATLEALGFTDIRITRALTKLIASGDNLSDSLTDAATGFHKTNAATDEAEKRFATFEKQLQFLKNALVDIGVEFGTTLLPVLRKDILPLLKDGLEVVKGWIDAWKGMSDEQRRSALMWAGVAAAMGPVLLVGGKIVSAFSSIFGLMGGIARITGKMGGAGGAVAKLSAQPVFVTNWPPGMMTGGGAGAGPMAAGSKGIMSKIFGIAGKVFGLAFVAVAGFEIGKMIGDVFYNQAVKPAVDYEMGQWDQFLKNVESDPGGNRAAIEHNLGVVTDALANGPWGKDIDFIDRALMGDEIAILESQKATLEQLLDQAKQPKPDPAVKEGTAAMNAVDMSIKHLEERQATLLEQGRVDAAARMQHVIDGTYALKGAVDRTSQQEVANIRDMKNRMATTFSNMSAREQAKLERMIGQENLTRATVHAMGSAQLARLSGVIAAINAKQFTAIQSTSYHVINNEVVRTGTMGGHLEHAYHTGGWDVPGGPATLSPGEMVLPPRAAKAFRALAERGSLDRGDGNDTYVTNVKLEGLMYARTSRELGESLHHLSRTGKLHRKRRFKNGMGNWSSRGS